MSLIRPSRRDILRLAAVAPAFALPVQARAALGTPNGAQPAFHRFSLGSANITIVSDGHLSLPVANYGINADPAEVQAFLTSHFLSASEMYSHTNHVVVEIDDNVVLIDVGSGARFLDTAGRLMTNLEAAGIDPGSITHVVITHAHPDHIWGIRDDFDEPILPDAQYTIGEAEYAWWMADDLANRTEGQLQQFVVGAVNSLSADGLEWTLAADGHEVVPGVRLLASPGHTPGHMSVHVESDGEQLIALGDCITHPYLSLERPDWVNGSDQIPDLTVTTRRKLLDMVATDRIAVVGYHFPFPGVGHVLREGDSYRFLPALWRWQE